MPARKKTTAPGVAEPRLDATTYLAGDSQLAVSFAGLLADDTSLRTAELTRSEWDRRLAAYLSSPRP